MRFRFKPSRVLFSIASAALMGQFALAQDEVEDASAVDEAAPQLEEVTVTGSRLKRDTYSSVSPLQIISTDLTKSVGLIDAGSILQTSTAASGQQIDLTFQGFVLDNGPGSSTVDLRGLGANRTLVLVNGRRLAPGGVEGAPYAPDLNLVPRSLVQQYDLLLDGASSVYGSDAIAGVVNAVLRKDFDGLELEVYSQMPDQDGGDDNTFSLTWGTNTDRGVFGFGMEYVKSDRVKLKDRKWTDQCERNAEIDQSGKTRSADVYYSAVQGFSPQGDCTIGALAGWLQVFPSNPRYRFQTLYATPGVSNGGWPGYSEQLDPYGLFASDGSGDGIADISYQDYNLNGSDSALNADLFPEYETQNYMAYGEYTFDGEANLTPYFEAMYSKREYESNSGEGQLFPYVPDLNPFNPCNPNQPNGVDCGLAGEAYLNNPSIGAQWTALLGGTPAQYQAAGFPIYSGPTGPALVRPIVSVRGDRNLTETETEQGRFVAGIRGDMPFMNVGTLNDWSFDAYFSYSKSSGKSKRFGIREDRLDYALGWYSAAGDTPCQDDYGILGSDVTAGCVPVNMFATSLLPNGSAVTGDFSSQAERDYLFDTRDFDTDYEQTIFSVYATGDIFTLPAGEVAVGLGFESRKDEIDSSPDDIARDGLFFGFFSDGGAVGDKTVDEFFGEVEVPLLANVPGFVELTVNASFRITDDEYYGTNNTESFKLGWRPIDSLMLKATYGTAFRAPNLRELFLLGQSGFTNIFDPCYIPDGAIDNLTGQYVPENDKRDPLILANCAANGVDPTLANNGGFNTFSTEVSAGGSLELDPEESESWTAGFSWEQPFTNSFDLRIGMTYYEIEIENTVIEPSAQFIVNDCYGSNTGTSPFCSRITRDLSDPTDPYLLLLDSGFINRDEETARGIDYNLSLAKTVDFFGPVDLSLDLVANKTLERSTLFVDDAGNVDKQRYEGEWGFPEWKGNAYFRASWDKWSATWEMRYIDGMEQDPLSRDPFEDAITGLSDTCFGPPDDVLCRDIGDTDDYLMHSFSVYYEEDTWTLGFGIRNVFEADPPFVDGSEVLSINNTPIGYGYDLNGRTFFLNLQARIGGGS